MTCIHDQSEQFSIVTGSGVASSQRLGAKLRGSQRCPGAEPGGGLAPRNRKHDINSVLIELRS